MLSFNRTKLSAQALSATTLKSVVLFFTLYFVAAASESPPLSSTEIQYTPSKYFGHGIEGAAYRDGYIYAVHWRGSDDSTPEGSAVGRNVIGRVRVGDATKEAVASLLEGGEAPASAFFVGPPESLLNGIEFTADGRTMLLADAANKRVLAVKIPRDKKSSVPLTNYYVYCESPDFDTGVPNDLALDPTGDFLYLSGQEWNGGGGLWMCTRDGTTTNLVPNDSLGRTNGIAVSPDGLTLYVSEAVGSPVPSGGVQVINRYGLSMTDGTLITAKEAFVTFEGDDAAVDTDGMQCDNEGNLYATRNGGKLVAAFSPDGEAINEVVTQSPNPTNLVVVDDIMYITARCEGGAWNRGDGCWEVAVLYDEVPECAPGTVWDQEKLMCVHAKPIVGPCGSCGDNPCTKEAIKAGEFYHEHCSKNEKYLQCGGVVGMCFEMQCAPGTVWSQLKRTCEIKN